MKSQPDIPVLLTSADSNFALPCAVMLRSVADNLVWTPRVRAIIADVGLTAYDRRRIRSSVLGTALSVEFMELPAEAFAGLKVDGHISRGTYARLVALDRLKDRTDKCIYIDADFVVLKDIGELWELDLGDQPVAAVRDLLAPVSGSKAGLKNPGLWGIPEDCPYFNSGMLVVNVLRWMGDGIGVRSLEVIRQHPGEIRWWDQDAINIVAYGRIMEVDPVWNVHAQALTAPRAADLQLSPEIIDRCMSRPRAIHFAGPTKPWQDKGLVLGADYFMRYLYRTAWKNRVPNAPWLKPKISPGLRLRQLAKRIQAQWKAWRVE